ncbi:NB-ARC domain-containing protein [Streptomyces sp. NBC_00233]|uniref:NB-ARC domain-containing protein n=1 Tax=Streptomyces sp. NBC_00233 TaxID=2975686 RepID=UPI002253112A|nr:NB-ARC domain-containing protein [Streptomyces sp. NBC_00233]MCX5232020.1 NB-ARC domain-containing protein [Streptomyces sp. NBC_00233]
MVELVTLFGGMAARLAGQLFAPKAKRLLLGPPETKELERISREVLPEVLSAYIVVQSEPPEVHVSRIDPADDPRLIAHHLETVLGRLFADASVADAVVTAALARKEVPWAAVMTATDAAGIEPDTLGIDLKAFFGDFVQRFRTEVRAAAAQADSPLFHMVVLSDLDRAPPSRQPRVVGLAPPPPRMLVGRGADVEHVRSQLSSAAAGDDAPALQVVTAVRGWPGVGKTTLAAQLVHDPSLAASFAQGVLWARLGSADRVRAELARWAREVDEEPDPLWATEELSARLAAVLRNRRMLLVVDDVVEPRDAVPFLVGGPRCATVITTRRRDVADALASSPEQVHWLDVLTTDDSVELLRRLAPGVADAHPAALRVLAERVEGLPLALQVAGKLLHSEFALGLPVDDLAESLGQDARLLSEEVPPQLAGLVEESSPTVAAVLSRSVATLDPVSRLRFAYLGAFAPKPATFTIDAATEVWGAIPATGELSRPDGSPLDTVRVLTNRGLLESAGGGTYQMHGLLALYASHLLDAL